MIRAGCGAGGDRNLLGGYWKPEGETGALSAWGTSIGTESRLSTTIRSRQVFIVALNQRGPMYLDIKIHWRMSR